MSIERVDQWESVPLEEVLEFREGPGIMARDFREEGVPLLRLAGLKRGAPLLAGCNHLDPDMVKRRWSHFRVRPGDVLLSTSASLGEVAVVDESAAGAVPYTGIICFRPRDERLRADFVEYALRAPSFAGQIEAMGVGSVMRHFGPMHLRQMTVDVPPVSVQAAIAEVLGALDNNIDANERKHRALDELVRALHQRAVADAEREVALGSLFDQGLGGVWGNDAPSSDEDVQVACLRGIDLVEIAKGQMPSAPLRWLSAKPVAKREWTPGEIWVEASGSFCGRSLFVGDYLPRLFPQPVRNSNFVKRLVPRASRDLAAWAWLSMRRAYDAGDFAQWRTGSAFPNLDLPAVLGSLMVPLPPDDVLKRIAALVDLLLDASTVTETRSLVALRDALLPSLMSGELRVRDAESLVGEAV